MKKKTTGIIEAIKALTKEERTKFAVWLAETGKAKEDQRAWKQILVLGDKFEETKEDKKIVFTAAYGTKSKYSARVINALFRQLVDWIGEFDALRQMERSGQIDLYRARFYDKIGDYDKRDEAINTTMNKAWMADESTRLNILSQVFYEKYFFIEDRLDHPEIHKILDELLLYSQGFAQYLIFKTILDSLICMRIKGTEVPLKIKQVLNLQFALLPENNSSISTVYVLAIKFYLAPSHDAYHKFKNIYIEKLTEFDRERKFLLIYLMGCITFLSPPLKNEIQEYFSLFKLGFEKGIFLEDGELEAKLFNNFVFVLKSLDELDLIESFINTHHHLIKKKKEQKNAVHLAKCYLLFGKKKIDLVLNELDKIKPSYPVFNLRIYLLEFMCILENSIGKHDAYDQIKEKEGSFRRLLLKYKNNGAINADNHEYYLNFLILVRDLSNHRNPKITKKFLQDKLETLNGRVTEKSWLLKKIAERK